MNVNTHFLSNVRVAGSKELLDLVDEISRHLLRGNVCKCAKSQPNCIHIRVIHVAGRRISRPQHRGTCTETHFFKELVTSVRTSWLSSSKSMIPRYPRRLSVKRGLATSFRHSIWPKWAGEPSMCMYRSFATLLCRAYESSSLKEALMAADSCWMRARSSATVWVQKMSDCRVTEPKDQANLAGSDSFDEGCGTNQNR